MIKLSIFLAAVALAGSACHHRVAAGLPGTPPANCVGAVAVTWIRAPHDPRLDQWCAQVGSALVVAAPADAAARVDRVLILSWNVHVGGARVVEVVEWLRSRAVAEGRTVGFVLLLQEAYRAGGDIHPPIPGGGIPAGIHPVRPALDVEALGRYLRMSVAYVPSMRNGDDEAREDRGNAVLSTEPMSDVGAIELPFGKERRVATLATITPRGASSFRVIAAHLDTFWRRAAQRRQAEGLAEQIERLKAETTKGPLVMGIDTNARDGRRDKTVKILAKALPIVEACSSGRSTPYLLRFDFLFSALEPAQMSACETLPDEYGSDHRPLVLTVDTVQRHSDSE